MEIFVKTWSKSNNNRRTIKMKVQSNDTIKMIQKKLVEEEKIPLEKQFFTFPVSKSLKSIDKLDDAKSAGKRDSQKCTLILTEGDSAKAFVMSGLSVIENSKNLYGVFPLKGKIPNISKSKVNDIINNDEIQSLITILGLKTSSKNLRYGHVMIMSDPDLDGSHFKGLLINLIYMLWPSLLRTQGFLSHFFTPLIKVFKFEEKQLFYSHEQYEKWKKERDDLSSWETRYYKGLGSNTPEEAFEYFQNIEDHKKDFVWESGDDEAIDLAFDYKNTVDRKKWIESFKHEDSETYLKARTTTYANFIHSELILYAIANVGRTIPSLVDGLKTVERKIVFSLLLSEEMKPMKSKYITNLIGYASERTCYHHNEVSMANTVIKMGRDYANSNNINLLLPLSHFGSSNLCGRDYAAHRYAQVKLSSITRCIFRKDDDMLLDYLNVDGESIEPYCYMPIIPMILVNGCDVVAIGWRSYIPKYNPRKIIKNIESWLESKTITAMTPMTPWYRGFRGTIEKGEVNGSFVVNGKVLIKSNKLIEIEEIPFTRWSTKSYKEFLTSLTKIRRGKKPSIESFEEIKTGKTTKFKVHLIPREKQLEIEDLMKEFHLRGSISTKNMILLDKNMKITKYDSPEEILTEFMEYRLSCYEKKKKHKVDELELDMKTLYYKILFIELVTKEKSTLTAAGMKKKELISMFKKILLEKKELGEHNYPEEHNHDAYDFVISMPFSTFCDDSLPRMKAELQNMEKDIEILKNQSPKDMWLQDLKHFESIAVNLSLLPPKS
ncbi:DNA topoisomerase 2-like [Vicia villosa]|uniref:DNA topoisomerase 2-like n=1 Tax=Vicia villosa TaxID=3911 RepID=UPI00273B30CB|nr:DNA topoisomerase 2-like [Vicia villosa]